MDGITGLRRHIRKHASILLKCNICNVHLTSTEEKQFHLCDSIKPSIKCEHCDGQFQAISTLLAHLERDHFQIIMHKCRKCSTYFGMQQLVDLHEKHHLGEEFACSKCWFKFADEKSLDTHMQSHSAASMNISFINMKCKLSSIDLNCVF